MPPISFVAAGAAPTWAGSVTMPTPAGIKIGDFLIAVVAVSQTVSASLPVPSAGSWLTLSKLISGSSNQGTVYILGRFVDGTEGPSYVFDIGPGVGAEDWGAGCMVAYRGVSRSITVATAALATIVASVNFGCPTETPARYSDLYMGIVVVSDATIVVAPPAGTTERLDFAQNGASGTLEIEVFDYIPEATAATGTKTATVGVAHSGVAVSVLIPAAEPPGYGKAINLSPPGGIGLPRVGV